ncbi:MAG: heterodisulfide reductase-related iron-sulfur binding cluster, partial [Promethearchaeota archaeon]
IIRKYGSPFSQNKSRMKKFKDIKTQSDTLLYLGCFTTVKTPHYGEDVVAYLLNAGIEFTILKEEICCGYPILCNGSIEEYDSLVQKNRKIFEEKGYRCIITACPSCYMVFKKEYADINIEIRYFTEFLKPSQGKKSGNIIIQHACPLRNGEIPNIADELEVLYEKSGYNVLKNIPRACSGGGVGHQLRTDIIETIALKRMDDFSNSIPSDNRNIQNNYIITYCPDAYWIIKVFGRRKKISFQLKTMCEMLME